MEPFKGFATPGMPLFAVTPQRVNRNPPGHAHPTTPFAYDPVDESDESDFPYSWHDRPTPSLDNDPDEITREQEIGLKKAIMGWEEAAAEARKAKDEVAQLKKKIEEGKERERMVGNRLDGVMVRQPDKLASCVAEAESCHCVCFSNSWTNTSSLGGVPSCERDTCSFPGALRKGSETDEKRGLQSFQHRGQSPRGTQEREEPVE